MFARSLLAIALLHCVACAVSGPGSASQTRQAVDTNETGDDASVITGDPGGNNPAGDDGTGVTVSPGDDADMADPSDAGPGLASLFPPPADPGDGGMCANLGCFDVFDCAIYHAAQFGPCGFTQCVGLVCTK